MGWFLGSGLRPLCVECPWCGRTVVLHRGGNGSIPPDRGDRETSESSPGTQHSSTVLSSPNSSPDITNGSQQSVAVVQPPPAGRAIAGEEQHNSKVRRQGVEGGQDEVCNSSESPSAQTVPDGESADSSKEGSWQGEEGEDGKVSSTGADGASITGHRGESTSRVTPNSRERLGLPPYPAATIDFGRVVPIPQDWGNQEGRWAWHKAINGDDLSENGGDSDFDERMDDSHYGAGYDLD